MKAAERDHQIELALNEVMFTHRLVFEALELANKNPGGAVLLGEIIAALTEEQVRALNKSYKNPLINTVRQILISLINRKLVFIACSDRHRHYYAAVSVFSQQEMPFVFRPSYRQMVIELMKDAITYYNRAVRLGDIDRYLNDIRPDLKGDCKWFRRTIQRLANEGMVKIVARTRQDKYGGQYYLLHDMDIAMFDNPVPPPWVETVLRAFHELWEKQSESARLEGRLPAPLTTVEIKNYIYERYGENIVPHEKNAVANAVLILARPTANQAIRRLRRESYSKCLWVPFEVKDDEIELYGLPKSDSERANLLVRHAVERLRRPVTQSDLGEELKLRPELQLARPQSMNVLLTQQNKFSDVKRIGWFAAEWYYYVGNINSPPATSYLTLKRVEAEWKNLNAVFELNDLDNCSLKTAAYGRCVLIKNTLESIVPKLRALKANKKFGTVVNTEAETLYEEIIQFQPQIKSWLDNNASAELELPEQVNPDVAGLTPEELWTFLQPLYPKSVKVRTITDLSNLLGNDIRRFRNPFYKPSFCDGTLETVQYLFDRTDAFMYAARKWGGRECCLQAVLAGNNLGLLRDVNFVIPGLSSNDYNERLIAVACLAFLQPEGAADHLAEVCLNDADAGVRESALWAFGFVGGSISHLADKLEDSQEDRNILNYVSQLKALTQVEFWFV